MVSIIENWAIVVGIVIGIAPPQPGEKFATLTVQVERTETFETYPMLVQQKPGDRALVRVLPEQIESTADLLNATVSIRVRRARDPQILFAAHDWKPADSEAP